MIFKFIDKNNYKDNCVLNFEKYKDDNSSIFKIINKL